MGLEERGYPKFRLCLSWYSKWVFYMGTLLEAICIVLEIYFKFRLPNKSPIEDSLTYKFVCQTGIEIAGPFSSHRTAGRGRRTSKLGSWMACPRVPRYGIS